MTWVPGLDVYPFIVTDKGRLITGALRGGTLVNQWTMRTDVASVGAASTLNGAIHLAALQRGSLTIWHEELPRLGQWTGWRDISLFGAGTVPAVAVGDIAVATDSYGRVHLAATGWMDDQAPLLNDGVWHSMRETNGRWSTLTSLYHYAGLACYAIWNVSIAGH